MVHSYRTGRPSYWFYIILFFPGIGSLVYITVEILPAANWDHLLDLDFGFLEFFRKRRLARLADKAEFAPTVENRSKYADELAHQGETDQAIEIYQGCLRGALKDDSSLIFALAGIQEKASKWDGVLTTLSQLRPEDYRRENTRSLRYHAIALDGLQRYDEAIKIFRELLDGWPGEEIRCRLAVLLLRLNHFDEAIKLFEEIKLNSKRGSSHYRVVNRYWIRWALHILKTETKPASAT